MKRILLSISVLFHFFANGQNSISTQLNSALLPFEINEDSIQLGYLDTLLSNNRILALGEETHATSEFFTSKSKIIQYCVSNLNYKIIGIEADFIGTQYLNKYITEGFGIAKEGLYKMGTSAWITEEILELIEWLHYYNQDKSQEQKVVFFGFDMQASNNTISELKSMFLKQEWQKRTSLHYLDSIATWKTVTREQQQIYALLSKELSLYKDSLPPENQEAFSDHLLVLDQYISFKSAKNLIARLNSRDQSMAENIQLIHNRDSKKMIIWAHNEHISKNTFMPKWQTMGNHLANKYHNQYFAIGLYTADINLKYYNRFSKTIDSLSIPLDSSKHSLNTILSQCDRTTFFLSIQGALKTNSSLEKFVSEKFITRQLVPNPAKNNRYGFDIHYSKSPSLMNRYDAIIFLKDTHGAKPLSSSFLHK